MIPPADRTLYAVALIFYLTAALHLWQYSRPVFYPFRLRVRFAMFGIALLLIGTYFLCTAIFSQS